MVDFCLINAYNIKQKSTFLARGGCMVRINPVIMNFLTGNGNLIKTADVLSLGFSKQLLFKYVKEGLLERVRHGIYILSNNVHDDMYTLMLRSPHIIFSHSTALFLNGLSDRTPFVHYITLPSNKCIPTSIKDECFYFYIKPELHSLGLTERVNTFGNILRCYDPERTICDFLRTRNRCDEETVISAIKNYANYNKKNLNKLDEYSELLNVKSELKRYLEVLL